MYVYIYIISFLVVLLLLLLLLSLLLLLICMLLLYIIVIIMNTRALHLEFCESLRSSGLVPFPPPSERRLQQVPRHRERQRGDA